MAISRAIDWVSSWFKPQTVNLLNIATYDRSTQQVVSRNFVVTPVRKIGEGCYGVVWEGQMQDKNGKPHGRVAIKVIKDPKKFDEKEFKMLGRYYFAQKVEKNNQIYLITEFFPGEELISDDKVPHSKLHTLSFSQRIHLIAQIAAQFNVMHHFTPSTGNTTLHGDIKGSNIRVNIKVDPKTGEVLTRANPVDFGLSVETQNSSAIISRTLGFTRNENYAAPEALKSTAGVASDIYMMTAVFAEILGETDAYRSKYHAGISGDASAAARTEYSLNLMSFPTVMPEIDLKKITLLFLNRMQSYEISQRPSTDEVLRFFITLDNLMLNYERRPHDPAIKQILAAQLLLMAHGRWQDKIGNKEMDMLKKDKSEDLQKVGTRIVDKTFQDFDFAAYPKTCEAILAMGTKLKDKAIDLKKRLNDPISKDQAQIRKADKDDRAAKPATPKKMVHSGDAAFIKNAKAVKNQIEQLVAELQNHSNRGKNCEDLLQKCNNFAAWFNEILDMYQQPLPPPLHILEKEIRQLQQEIDKGLQQVIDKENSQYSPIPFRNKADAELLKIAKEGKNNKTPPPHVSFAKITAKKPVIKRTG